MKSKPWTTREVAILEATYADDAVESAAATAASLLPGRTQNTISYHASILGFSAERKRRRAALGLTRSAKAAAAPREGVVLPWRIKRPKGNVRPVMCPRCGEAFAVAARDLSANAHQESASA
ncbi:MAG: hypothetical protein JWO85_2568 [Candidatus Eremiobacteraeota bacterium]|nr:hypothetical protein [Candidatus Eremiobacteraeota bacterium]